MHGTFRRISHFVLSFALALAGACFGQAMAPVIAVDHGANSPAAMAKPYVILVSLDGFRYDYAKRYHAEHLLALGAEGASAPEGMLPSYPSITFPNHYTIVTGLYPEHHGIVANNFYDPARKETYSYHDSKAVGDGTWYGGTPLWVLAEQAGDAVGFVFLGGFGGGYSGGATHLLPEVRRELSESEAGGAGAGVAASAGGAAAAHDHFIFFRYRFGGASLWAGQPAGGRCGA